MPDNGMVRKIAILAGVSILVFGLIYGGISMTKNIGKSKRTITTENAMKVLDNLYKDIAVSNVPARKDTVSIDAASTKDALPDITKYPAQVESTTPNFIEIFSSPEKAGDKTDGWLVETTKAFNNAHIQINGAPVSVRLRSMASGQGMDYIVSGKYLPQAFSPSNELWGEIMKSKGINVTLAEKRLAGNVPGILLSKAKYDQLIKKYGAINLKTITEAVANGEIQMGYTNPFASSTGLNFLLSTLNAYDSKDLLSEKAVQGFEKFQANIPFVAYTTMQMRDSATSGVFDGFVLEYQSYFNTPQIKSNYIFTPFGVRHDSPVYAIGDLTQMQKDILNKYIEFCKSPQSQKLATDYGFNNCDDYTPEFGNVSGDVISQAQQLWKEKKDANNDIAAVFVADMSGSMSGVPLNKLKQSLISGSQYIKKDVSVGMVSFSTDVNINLPIAKFDLNQRALFTGAVKDLQAGGNTAMYDGIVVATKMLVDEKAKNPNVKPMLFVLTDGQTNCGHTLNDI
ncbi:MAG: VWA domain-containing protein, partial [Bacillota bacterium]|nr:VWA domain-containing protein [Bacillota bacterium]